MAWPFTPLVTFLSKSVPKVTHTFLNALQTAQNAVARPVYLNRLSIRAESYDQTNVLVYPSAVMIKDSATAEYVYIEPVGYTVSATWPTSAWRYLYMVSTNGVASIEVSSTAPTYAGLSTPLFKSGDETRRYLCAVYCDGSADVLRFSMVDGRYTYCGDGHSVLSGAAGTGSWASLDLSATVPAWVRKVAIQVRITNGAGSISPVAFRSYGGVEGISATCAASIYAQDTVELPVNSSTIEWNGVASTTTDAAVLGWEE